MKFQSAAVKKARKNIVNKTLTKPVDKISSPSYYPQFTERYYDICPACAGVSFNDYNEDMRNRSCIHHQHELTAYKMHQYELADKTTRERILIEQQQQKLSRLHTHLPEGSPWSMKLAYVT